MAFHVTLVYGSSPSVYGSFVEFQNAAQPQKTATMYGSRKQQLLQQPIVVRFV